jgi:hypothetical protein
VAGLDVSHHARISQRGGEKAFFLTSSFSEDERNRLVTTLIQAEIC